MTLAFAHKIRQAILSGEIKGQAEAARRVGLTRARLSQILDLTNLAPDLQEEILFLEAIGGREPLSERALRGVLRVTTWAEQRMNRRRDCHSAPPASPYVAANL
jgi:ParB-like chromosome segregation protein Spo0J